MGIGLFNNNPLLEKALDGSWLRNEALSNNIANVNTPNYIRQDVNFQDYLKAAMSKDTIRGIMTDPRHIPMNGTSDDEESASNVHFQITKDYSTSALRSDGNNVDIDKEMAELAKNQILYNTFAEMINKNFSMTMSAIKEGR